MRTALGAKMKVDELGSRYHPDTMTEADRQALKRKLKRQVRGPKEAKRVAKVAEKAKSMWDV